MKDRILILFLVVFTFLSMIFYNFIDTLVIRKGYVESIRNGYVTIIDNFGEIWESGIENNQNLYSGQKVKMIMNNNHTEDEIKDDIIMKIVVDN